jgi:hypothetical protein
MYFVAECRTMFAPQVDGPAQVRRRNRVVEHERDPGVAGDCRERFDVDDVDQRVAERLGVSIFVSAGSRGENSPARPGRRTWFRRRASRGSR